MFRGIPPPFDISGVAALGWYGLYPLSVAGLPHFE